MKDTTGQSERGGSAISLEQLDLLLRELDHLPAIPAIAARLLTLASASDSPEQEVTHEILELVACDPSLTAMLLKKANKLSGPAVTSVAQAALAIGPSAVVSTVLSAKTFELTARQRADQLQSTGMWRHSLAVAIASSQIAEKLTANLDPSLAYTCGLLHGAGKLAMTTILPKSYRRVIEQARLHRGNIAHWERRIIGMDHSVVGRRLAEQWKLGSSIQHVIWMYSLPGGAVPSTLPDSGLIAVVALADAIARHQRIGFSGNYLFPQTPNDLAARVGLSDDELRLIADDLGKTVDQRIGELHLQDATDRKDQTAALAKANWQLGTINEQLRIGNDILACHAKAFECYRQFAAGMSDDTTVPDALTRIVEVISAAAGLGDDAADAIAYSVDGQTNQVLALKVDRGESVWRSFAIDNPAQPPGELQIGCSNLLGDNAEFAQWAQVIGVSHEPFNCQGKWIGGVYYRTSRIERAGPDARLVVEALASALAMALGIVQGRCRAVALSETLTSATQVLTETHQAMEEARLRQEVGEIAAGAAHELNTPLAVVSGRAQLMRARATTDSERETWQLIADQAQRISDTISDLMEFASPRRPKREEIDISQMLRAAVNSFSASDHAQAALSNVDIKTGQPLPPIWADRAQIETAIVELISNAATATAGRSAISLEARTEPSSGGVLITVADSGPGMDDKTLTHAFTPFFSLQKAGRRRGLGLPRIKRYVENNGGRIWIHTRPGEGTTVYVQLPSLAAIQREQDTE